MGKRPCSKTLILGIGSIIRKDDGVGIHVINRLREMNFPANIAILDGGTAGFDLLHYLQGLDKLIVVDAILTDEEPGTIRILLPEDINIIPPHPPLTKGGRGDFHQIGLIETLETANLLWGAIEAIIIGIVPKDYLNYGMELTPEINKASEKVIDFIKNEVLYLEKGNI